MLRVLRGLHLPGSEPFRDLVEDFGLASCEFLAVGAFGDHDLENRVGWLVWVVAEGTAWTLLGTSSGAMSSLRRLGVRIGSRPGWCRINCGPERTLHYTVGECDAFLKGVVDRQFDRPA